MFRSSSFHSIDSKNRIIIPSRFREFIRSDGGNGVMISNMDDCLYAYTLNGWKEIEKKMLSAKNLHMRDLKRFFLGNACECMMDRQHRILIPPTLKAYAKLEKDIVVVGILDHFEIWDRSVWEKENRRIEQEMKTDEARQEIAALGL